MLINALNAYCSMLIVNLKAFREMKGQEYAVCVGLLGKNGGDGSPYTDAYHSTDGRFEIELQSGAYHASFIHPSSQNYNCYFYLPASESQVVYNVELDQFALPEKIDSVRMFGNFNNYSSNDALHLKYNESKKYWYLPKAQIPEDLDNFQFFFNNNLVCHTFSQPFTKMGGWATVGNKYDKSGTDIILKLSDFKQGIPVPKVSGTFDNAYQSLCEKLAETIKTQVSAMEEVKTRQDFDLLTAKYNKGQGVIDSLKQIYIEKYDWAFVYYLLEWIQMEPSLFVYTGNSLVEKEAASKRVDMLKKQVEVIKLLKSYALTPYEIVNQYYRDLLMYSYHYYDLHTECNLPYDFIYQRVKAIIEWGGNDELCSASLMALANSIEGNKGSVLKNLEKIKNSFPASSWLKDGLVDRKIKSILMDVGQKAPDFNITTLQGNKLSLASLKGKYVFLDFWGTWCAPCRNEIPNIKKLSESISADDLLVIGIICYDTPEKAGEFLIKNAVEYDNAIGDDLVRNDYGIEKYPTTFLIDREGNIIAKDLRGDLLTDAVKSLIIPKSEP
jgi:peroxiredoxin